MLGLVITRTVPLHPHGVFVQWDLTQPTEVGNYIFDVYRGGAPTGPWTLLQGGASNIFSYVDQLPTTPSADRMSVNPNQLSTMRGLYYRITATPPSGSAQQVEAIATVEPTLSGRQRLLKRKILRDESVMLKKLNGLEVAVCKRMHWGPRCQKCFDKYTKEVVRGACTNCYGTGFVPGYHTPVVTLARRSVAAPQTQLTPQGKSDVATAAVTLLDIPYVEEDDLLVFFRDNRRFVVKRVIPTELKAVTVHQDVEVSELSRSSIEYRLPVDPFRIPPLF